MATIDQVDAVVQARLDAAINQANALTTQANTYAQQAIAAAQSYFQTGPITDIVKPTIVVENFSPKTDLGVLFKTEYDNALTGLDGSFLTALGDFTARFYPNLKQYLGDQPEKWLSETIANGGIGIPLTQEDAIFQRARDREIEASYVSKDQAANEFAARGFALPTGAMAARFQQADLQAQKNISESVRTEAIEVYKMRIETLKFAVQEAGRYKQGAYELILKMTTDRMRNNDLAGSKAKGIVDSLKTLYDATAEYYRAVTTVQGLLIDVDKFNKDMKYRLQSLDFQSFDSSLKSKTQAAVSVSDLFSRSAAAYVGAQNTIVQLSSVGNLTQ